MSKRTRMFNIGPKHVKKHGKVSHYLGYTRKSSGGTLGRGFSVRGKKR